MKKCTFQGSHPPNPPPPFPVHPIGWSHLGEEEVIASSDLYGGMYRLLTKVCKTFSLCFGLSKFKPILCNIYVEMVVN